MAQAIPLLLGGLVGFGASKLMAPKPTAAAPVQAPKVMPMADDDEVARAKRASMMQQRQRGGRTSTMLTSDSDTLGN